jgi:hypothetical protein
MVVCVLGNLINCQQNKRFAERFMSAVLIGQGTGWGKMNTQLPSENKLSINIIINIIIHFTVDGRRSRSLAGFEPVPLTTA